MWEDNEEEELSIASEIEDCEAEEVRLKKCSTLGIVAILIVCAGYGVYCGIARQDNILNSVAFIGTQVMLAMAVEVYSLLRGRELRGKKCGLQVRLIGLKEKEEASRNTDEASDRMKEKLMELAGIKSDETR